MVSSSNPTGVVAPFFAPPSQLGFNNFNCTTRSFKILFCFYMMNFKCCDIRNIKIKLPSWKYQHTCSLRQNTKSAGFRLVKITDSDQIISLVKTHQEIIMDSSPINHGLLVFMFKGKQDWEFCFFYKLQKVYRIRFFTLIYTV